MKAPAIGYLRRDVSGHAQVWHETQIRSLAARYGYDIRKVVALTGETRRPIEQVIDVVRGAAIEAVFVPSADHFADGEIPEELIRAADVITVADEATYARRLLDI